MVSMVLKATASHQNFSALQSIFKEYINVSNLLVYLDQLKFYCQSLLLVLHSCLVSL